MAGINAQDFKIAHNGKSMSLDRPLWTFRFDNAVHLPWDMWLNVDFWQEPQEMEITAMSNHTGNATSDYINRSGMTRGV